MKNRSNNVTDHASEDDEDEESRFSQQSQALVPDDDEERNERISDHVQVRNEHEIFVTGGPAKRKKVFYQQFQMAPEPQLFAPRGLAASRRRRRLDQPPPQPTTTTNNHRNGNCWNVRVGDIVCMSNADAHPQSDAILAHYRHEKKDGAALWFPFLVPWSPCQILSIYRERTSSSSSSSSSSGTVWVEVRWLYRWSDLSSDFQISKLSEYRSNKEKESYEEVFETDYVSMDMPASSVIGRANLLLGTHCQHPSGVVGLGKVPLVTLRCGLYFLRLATSASSANDDGDLSKLALRSISMQGDITTNDNNNNNSNNNSNDPNDTNHHRTDWWERVCHRGVELSVSCSKYPELKRNTKRIVLLLNQDGDSVNEFDSSSLSSAMPSSDTKGTQTFSFGVIPSMPVVKQSDRIFYSSLSIRPPWVNYSFQKQLLLPPLSSSSSCESSRWTFRVGDVVAIQCAQSNRRSCALSDNDWGEQKVKWSACQIVSIYEDIIAEEESDTAKVDPTMEREGAHFRMEVRWMFRVSDFRDNYKKAAKEALQLSNEMTTTTTKGRNQNETEMIFETDYLDNGFHAKDVLAPILLLSRSSGKRKTTPVCFDRTSFCTPQEIHVLGKYFSVKHGRFMKHQANKLCDFRQRAVELSNLLSKKRDQKLMLAAIQTEVYTMDERVDKVIEKQILSVKQQFSKFNHNRKRKNDTRENDSVRTPTPKKTATKKLQTKSKTPSKQATVETKDAKRQKTSSQKKKAKIVKTASSEMAKAETKVAAQKRKKDSKPKRKSLKRALESEQQQSKSTPIVDSVPVVDLANEPRINPSIASEESSEESFLGEIRVFQCVDPFYVDISSFNSFYTELKITPPYERYASRNFDVDHSSNESWIVKLGDIVAVHYEDGKIRKNEDFTPFDVPSGIGEVVSIRKSHGSRHQALEIAKKYRLYKTEDSSSSLAMDHQNQIDSHTVKKESDYMLEIRWFYRKKEIHGISKSSFGELLDGELEEILETDEILSCSAYSLLAPCLLQESGTVSKDTPRVRRDMPLIRFQCHRFWSVHRKALVLSGTIDTRGARGRMYSQFFGNDRGGLKAALETELLKQVTGDNVSSENDTPLQNLEHRVLDTPLSWKEQFLNSIQALSLTDASAHVQVQGLSLPGREEERKRIIDFLRTAITGGMSSSDSVKSAMFIAGPPGTGKTASVRSIVTELRQEQARGTIPEFNFIALNGIEMRDPFDAYVKLWEALSGSEKDRRSAGVAAGLLEQYFTGSAQNGSSRKKGGAVTVLLLDEIDYLLTKKQTVLYNFFDWPSRASTEGAGSRLVVIGISNTINLPERLQKSVESRMGSNRCIFQSYKVDDIVKILKTRLAERSALSVFDEGAITFAARKTAVLSGDIRKAFQICKGAAEYVMIQLQSKSNGRTENVVTISDVQKVSREMFSSVMTIAVAHATPYEALLLISLASLARNSGREKGKFDIKELMTKMEGIASASGDMHYMPNLAFGDLLGLLNQLAEAQLVSLHTPTSAGYQYRAGLGGGGSTWPLISMPLEDFQIERSLRNTPHQKLAEKHLGSVF